MKNFINYLPFSKFMNWYSIGEYLKEFVIAEYDCNEAEVECSMLRFVEDGFGEDSTTRKMNFLKIFRGDFIAKNMKYTEIKYEMFSNSNAFLFHVRGKGSSFFKFGGTRLASEPLALENGPSTGASNYNSRGISILTSDFQGPRSRGFYNQKYSMNDYDNEITNKISEEKMNDGIVGFKNIGNTCYMNSAMQCLAHIDFLKEFLISNKFKPMINDDNPIGADGNLIKSLAALIKEYWTTHDSYVTPYSFKRCVSKYLPAFEGYSHHDSQEFLSQLLDKCHEDTNQILKKPYISIPTLHPGTKSDQQMGRESWILHLKRNNSFFIHNFFGQFRSEIQCPLCNSVYLKYDCFQVISLPIPSKREDSMDFFFISNDQRKKKALKTRFEVKSYSNFNDIKVSNLRKQILENDSLFEKETLFRVGFMGFAEESILMYDHRTISDLLTLDEQRGIPNLFVFEMVDSDVQVLTNTSTRILKDKLSKEEPVNLGNEIPKSVVRENCNNEEYLAGRSNLIFVLIKSTFDYYDEDSPIYSQIEEYKPRSWRAKEHPVFTKAFYLTKKHRVIDLYWRIFEKFEFKAVVKKERKSPYNSDEEESSEDSYENLTLRQKFEEMMKNGDMFFYVRINGVYYGEDQWYRLLEEFNGEYWQPQKENVLKVKVIFREGERKKCINEKKIPKVDLEYFTSCYHNNYLKMDFTSEEYHEKKTSSYSLKKLLQNFSQPETLDNENMYRCSKCKVEVKAQIKMEIQKVPRVLVIFFKRIKKGYYSESPEIVYPEFLDMKPFINDDTPIEAYNVRPEEILDEKNIEIYKNRQSKPKKTNKIDLEIDDSSSSDSYNSDKIEEEIDDSPSKDPLEQIYLPEPQIKTDLKYELFGVVNHYGSQNFGHYTSVVKTEKGWIDFNDERAGRADMSDVINKNAYMLFYLRKDH